MTAGAVDDAGTFTCHWFDKHQNGEVSFGFFNSMTLITVEDDDKLPGPDFADYAERAYKAYGDKANWKNYLGKPMPKWLELPENIRTYWTAAAGQIISDCNGKYSRRE
jgi:uncharacterized protein YodC (DUF2158 family)